MVGVGLQVTYNLGNHESLTVSVHLEEPITDEPGQDREAIFAALKVDVRTKLYERLAEEIQHFRELRPLLEAELAGR